MKAEASGKGGHKTLKRVSCAAITQVKVRGWVKTYCPGRAWG